MTPLAHSASAWRELGRTLFEQNRLAEALECLLQCIKDAPDDLLAHLLLGRLALRLNEPTLARRHFQRVLDRLPGNEPALSGLVDVAIALNQRGEAQRLADELCACSPCSEVAWFARARVGEAWNELDVAETAYQRLLTLAPTHPNHRYHYARLLLKTGRADLGWREYEHRFAAGAVRLPELASPRWQGEPVAHLLLLAEQGLGDVLQFARFIPLAQQRCQRVTLACPRTLAALLQRSLGVSTIALEKAEWPAHDAQLPLMSLPRLFELGNGAFRPVEHYLTSERQHRQQWRERLGLDARTINIGLVTHASSAHPTEQRPQTRRSCPPAICVALTRIPHQTVWWLAFDKTIEPGAIPDARPVMTGAIDGEDSAALLDLFDYIISVDTAAIHLAGALGKPCALLLPYASDWRWQQAAEAAPWYSTLRIFRQTEAGDWSAPLAELAQSLRTVQPSATLIP